jgi:hypothetical protein
MKILISIGALFFQSLTILLFVMPLNTRFLYIDLVAYCSDFSNTLVKQYFFGSKREGLPHTENLLKHKEEKSLQQESGEKKRFHPQIDLGLKLLRNLLNFFS